MILPLTSLTLNFSSIWYSWMNGLYFLKVSVYRLGRTSWLGTSLVELLYFVSYSSSSHKSIFFVVFKLLFPVLKFLLMNDLIIVKAFCNLFISNEALIKYVLLLLIDIDCWYSPLCVLTSLCSDCLTWYDTKLIISRDLTVWISCHSANSAYISRLLTSVSTSRLIRSSILTNKTTYTYRSGSIHGVFYICSYSLLIGA